jgi:HSP20 family molecular chaperone IbpA
MLFTRQLDSTLTDWLLDFDNNSGDLVPYHEKREGTNVLDIFVELPGSSKENVEVKPVDHGISITAKQTLGKISKEIKKSFSVSKKYDLSTTEAEMKDGVLKLTIKPRDLPTKTTRIEIK